jgi:hypothetical protein
MIVLGHSYDVAGHNLHIVQAAEGQVAERRTDRRSAEVDPVEVLHRVLHRYREPRGLVDKR